jgi:hypothetical protein
MICIHGYIDSTFCIVLVCDTQCSIQFINNIMKKIKENYSIQSDIDVVVDSDKFLKTTRKRQDRWINVDCFLKELIILCKTPESIDSIIKVKKELDETKIVLHKTIDSLLSRGEKIEDLLQKSNQLSGNTLSFYKLSQKTNRNCCFIL